MKKVNVNLEEDYFSDDNDFVELLNSPFVKLRKLDYSKNLHPQTNPPENGESSSAAQILKLNLITHIDNLNLITRINNFRKQLPK